VHDLRGNLLATSSFDRRQEGDLRRAILSSQASFAACAVLCPRGGFYLS